MKVDKVYLVGFMACGKTTIARALAARLDWRSEDVDELIVARERMKRGDVPYDLVDRLAAAAEDPRLTARRHRMAAQYLARIRLAALRAAARRPPA